MVCKCSRVINLLCVIAMTLASAARAEAPATQPAPAEWGQVVATVARGLIGDPDAASTAAALIGDDVPIRRFGSPELLTRGKIIQQTEGLSVVASRVYTWPAETIATDLATDFRNFDSFPDSLRRQFVPRDAPADIKRANTVAQQWVSSVLRPLSGEFVGVLVLWEPLPPVTTTSLLLGTNNLSEAKQPYFVLIKGTRTDSGDFRILQIVFGDAKQALN